MRGGDGDMSNTNWQENQRGAKLLYPDWKMPDGKVLIGISTGMVLEEEVCLPRLVSLHDLIATEERVLGFYEVVEELHKTAVSESEGKKLIERERIYRLPPSTAICVACVHCVKS